jgi:hypothetical protein
MISITTEKLCKSLNIPLGRYDKLLNDTKTSEQYIRKLLIGLNKDLPDEEAIDLSEIIKYFPLKHIIKYLIDDKTVNNELIQFSIWQLRQILHVYEGHDSRHKQVHNCIDAVEQYSRGEITIEELHVHANRVLPRVEEAEFEVERIYDSKGGYHLILLCSVVEIAKCSLNLALNAGIGDINIKILECFDYVVSNYPKFNEDSPLFKARTEKFKEIFLNND